MEMNFKKGQLLQLPKYEQGRKGLAKIVKITKSRIQVHYYGIDNDKFFTPEELQAEIKK